MTLVTPPPPADIVLEDMLSGKLLLVEGPEGPEGSTIITIRVYSSEK